MKLSELLTGLAPLDPRTGAIEATGVTADSRKVKRGDVFVAVPGTKADGLAYRGAGSRGGRRRDRRRGQSARAAAGRRCSSKSTTPGGRCRCWPREFIRGSRR